MELGQRDVYPGGPFTYHVLRDGAAPSSKALQIDDEGQVHGYGRCLRSVHYYTVYSVDSNNVASPASAATEADVP